MYSIIFRQEEDAKVHLLSLLFIPPSTGKQNPVSPNRNVHDMHAHTQERFNRILLHIQIINTCVFIFILPQ